MVGYDLDTVVDTSKMVAQPSRDCITSIAMHFLVEPVYCMTWIWTLHRAHNKLKSPIEEVNIWGNHDVKFKFILSRKY